jgi:hypothetical protein
LIAAGIVGGAVALGAKIVALFAGEQFSAITALFLAFAFAIIYGVLLWDYDAAQRGGPA